MNSSSWTETNHRYAFDNAPRCGARTKQNNGDPCRCPAIRGKKRCRIHGGGKGSGAQRGNSNALKHGYTTTIVKAFKQAVRQAIMDSQTLGKELIGI
jgi:hypothetical protein